MTAVGWSLVVEGLDAALDEVSGLDPLFLTADQKADLLLDLARVESRLAEVRLRVLATADDVAATDGSRDPAAWLAHRTSTDDGPLRAELALARRMTPAAGQPGLPALSAAMADGKLSLSQAAVIARAVDELPEDIAQDTRDQAVAWLVDAARQHPPRVLRVLGRKILEVVAPELAEAHEARRLAAEEAAAASATRLRLRDLPDGTTRLSGVLPQLDGHRLRTYLEALSSPRSMKSDGPRPRRHGAAFCALLEHLDPARLPHHGGTATTVIVTIDVEALRDDLAVAGLLGSEPITAAQARRLACNAKILPAVLGGRSEPLDLGRARRLFSTAQHTAMRLRDGRCRGEGCTVPAAWCEAHHLHPWSRGGRTNLADGVLFCVHHHHRAHDPAYRLELLPNGDVRFHRRE